MDYNENLLLKLCEESTLKGGYEPGMSKSYTRLVGPGYRSVTDCGETGIRIKANAGWSSSITPIFYCRASDSHRLDDKTATIFRGGTSCQQHLQLGGLERFRF